MPTYEFTFRTELENEQAAREVGKGIVIALPVVAKALPGKMRHTAPIQVKVTAVLLELNA